MLKKNVLRSLAGIAVLGLAALAVNSYASGSSHEGGRAKFLDSKDIFTYVSQKVDSNFIYDLAEKGVIKTKECCLNEPGHSYVQKYGGSELELSYNVGNSRDNLYGDCDQVFRRESISFKQRVQSGIGMDGKLEERIEYIPNQTYDVHDNLEGDTDMIIEKPPYRFSFFSGQGNNKLGYKKIVINIPGLEEYIGKNANSLGFYDRTRGIQVEEDQVAVIELFDDILVKFNRGFLKAEPEYISKFSQFFELGDLAKKRLGVDKWLADDDKTKSLNELYKEKIETRGFIDDWK